MKVLNYQLTFHTPAFLGNANQSGQWRTPPFKALLRQWWRVAYSASQNHVVHLDEMRRLEGQLFGNAWLKNDLLENDFSKSSVRLRLSHWRDGTLTQWHSIGSVRHPEVQRNQVGADLYLGYGPLTGTQLKADKAIQANETANFSLAYPEDKAGADLILQALYLMHRFGTVGGRSRNGWGSFTLTPKGDETPELKSQVPTRALTDALQFDWPHALGKDNRPAFWKLDPTPNWQTTMKALAQLKINLRTSFSLQNHSNGREVRERHLLSYPITRHSVVNWVNNARLPNSLRFKVVKTENQYQGLIFHFPCKPPPEFRHRQNLQAIWKNVYQFLDNAPNVNRI